MSIEDPVSEELRSLAGSGDKNGVRQVIERYRGRLKKMVAVRIDPRLSARVDPSDIVQEAVMDAETRLSEYLKKRPLPVYPWLRQLAWQRLVDLHHHHLNRQKRSVLRERDGSLNLPDESACRLVDQLVDGRSSPSARLVREESRHRVREAMDQLDSQDREILVLRHLEQMPVKEIAALLSISSSAVKMRRLRAIERLQAALGDELMELS